MLKADFKIFNGLFRLMPIDIDSSRKEAGAGAHDGVGPEMGKDPQGMIDLVRLIVTLAQGIERLLVVRSYIHGLADKRHSLFVFFNLKK